MRAVRKNTCRTRLSKNGRVRLIQLHMHQGSSLLPILRALSSFLCCPRPPSHHPFSLTSVSLVPALHLLPPSTPFWPYGTHPFFPHAHTISILSDLLYSLTHFPSQLSNPRLFFPNSIQSWYFCAASTVNLICSVLCRANVAILISMRYNKTQNSS